MPTFAQLTESTLLYMHGFTGVQEQATYLTAGVNDSVLSLPVADATALSRGQAEIDDELVWIDTVNTTALTAVLPPYGRGFRGTTAATHASGARVVSAPLFPRAEVKEALNSAVQAVYPAVHGVGETTFMFNPAITTYALPAGAEDILQVSWQTTGPSREWLPVRRYRVDSSAATSAFATGASISLYDAIVPGRMVKVVYTKVPVSMVNAADDFATVTGLPESCVDLVRLGAATRLIPFLDSPHLSGMSAESDFSSNMRPVGGAAQTARFLMQQYQIRLQEEAIKQQTLFPVRSHYTR